jgi:hypothetical protein
MQKFTTDVPESVAKALHINGRLDHFRLFDSTAELADYANSLKSRGQGGGSDTAWYGGMSWDAAVKAAREGDLGNVEASDALLSKFEHLALETHGKAWRNDVTGALPNVPAFIAGHPLNMRRRTRLESAAAPIAVIVDVTASAGVSAKNITTRGAAILALVRILATRRPVELWACASTGADSDRNGIHVAARLATAPMDLGTAAFALTHAAYLRRLGFAIGHEQGFAGGWPYGSHHSNPDVMPAVMAPAFSHVGETLCIEPMRGWDAIAAEPETWLENKLADMLPKDLAA